MLIKTQLPSGEIPWHKDGKADLENSPKTDPWDHVEAAIGLCIGGHFDKARNAFNWMSKMQMDDGSWYASYKKGLPEDKTKDANMTSYIAVGLYYYYLITKDINFLFKMWKTLYSAISFALKLQAKTGQIYWAISPEGIIDNSALLTGSSSIYMSLKCAIKIANKLGYKVDSWQDSKCRLGNAIQNKPYLFNMTKSRFSMDWFYPILSGAVTGDKAKKRIDKYWKKFVVEGSGIKCVADEPWVTLAETSEFVLALTAMGNNDIAKIVFNWICDKMFDDGSCWCGFTYPDMIVWPEDKMTWTNAVVLMAADALYNLTPASKIFYHEYWD